MENALEQARSLATAGMQALQQGNGAQAEQSLQQAVKLGWPGADIWIAMAHARALQGDANGQADALKKAVSTDPMNARAQLFLGRFHQMAGNRGFAVSAYRTGLQLAGGLAQKSEEMQQLVADANAFMRTEPARNAHPVDEYAQEAQVGSTAEDRQFSQSLDILAGRAIPQISRPTRYYYPGLPNREFYDTSKFGWVSGLAAQAEAIRQELRQLLDGRSQRDAGFGAYVETNGREGTAVSHPLQGNEDWSAFYLIKQGKRIEENIARCPRTMAAIDAIGADANPAPAPSVLFSLLKPGASIPPHHGMLNTRLICHLPIILPGNCGFRVGNDTREWRDGEVFIFDDTIEHEAWNASQHPRYVLIWEIWRPELTERQRKLVSGLFSKFGMR